MGGSLALKCPHCKSESTIKFGVFVRKRTRTHVQRYRCKDCGDTFSDQTLSKTYRQHRPDLNAKILEDKGSGKGIRRMALTFRTTKKTVQRKVKFLAQACDDFHRKHMSEWTRSPKPRFQFDEMQTFESDRINTLTVPVAVEVDSHFIVGAIAAYEASHSHYPNATKKSHNERNAAEIARKDEIIKDTLKMCRVMKPEGRIVIESDKKRAYPKYMKDCFADLGVHIEYLASDEEQKKNLFSINNIMACLRADNAMLRRSSWHICKDKNYLSDHLKIYTFYSNYLKVKGYKERVPGQKKKKVVYKTPAMHLGIFNTPVRTQFLLENC